MNFEIVGDITQVEIIAVGGSIRDLPRLRRLYGGGRWRKQKESQWCGFQAGIHAKRNCTGMKRMASAKKKSSASGTSTKRGKRSEESKFVVCVSNRDYPASL